MRENLAVVRDVDPGRMPRAPHCVVPSGLDLREILPGTPVPGYRLSRPFGTDCVGLPAVLFYPLKAPTPSPKIVPSVTLTTDHINRFNLEVARSNFLPGANRAKPDGWPVGPNARMKPFD